MNLVERVSGILLNPKDLWPQIEAEPASVASIYTEYLVFLAAIPAVATFIGMSLVGVGGFGFTYRVPLVSGLVAMVVGYVMSLAGIFVLGLIINALAPKFGGTKNALGAFKVAAYGATASFVGGVLNLVPALGMLGALVSLYSLYLIFLGLPVVMKCPTDRAAPYTGLVILAAVVVGLVMSVVNGIFYHGPIVGP